MKLENKTKSFVHGNDELFSLFGANGKRRHQHFRTFFTVQDPRKADPGRDKESNWKVKPFLDHLNEIFQEGILLAENISLDEMTISFKGNHVDKLRINFKRTGDGFQCDAICQDGYCYSFVFRNEKVDPKYADLVNKKELSRLHSRCLTLYGK